MAAVIGRDFDFDLLDAVTDFGQEEVIDVLDAASSAALVREVPDVPGRYSFSHALTQHTLYQGLPAVRRTRAHRQVAEAIEATLGQTPGGRVGELAHHWLSASQPANALKAILYARQAGEAALAALAPDDAVRDLSKALRLTEMVPEDDPMVGCDLRLALGEAERQAGLPGFRETFLDAAHRAQELAATDRLVAAALENSRGFFSSIGVIDVDKVACWSPRSMPWAMKTDASGRSFSPRCAASSPWVRRWTGARNWPTPPGRWRGAWGIRTPSSVP